MRFTHARCRAAIAPGPAVRQAASPAGATDRRSGAFIIKSMKARRAHDRLMSEADAGLDPELRLALVGDAVVGAHQDVQVLLLEAILGAGQVLQVRAQLVPAVAPEAEVGAQIGHEARLVFVDRVRGLVLDL